MANRKMIIINIAFDDGGGAVLASNKYAHRYDHGKQLATDVRVLLDGGNTASWDGNEPDLVKAFPAEANQYQIVYELEEIKDLVDNSRVEVDADERRVLIHWDGGNAPHEHCGQTHYDFWSALIGT